MQDRTQGSAPLKEGAKSTGVGRVAWLQGEELKICTKNTQSNTQLLKQAEFPGMLGMYTHSIWDFMLVVVLRRSQSSLVSQFYSTLWKPTGLPHAIQIAYFLHHGRKFCHHLCPEEHYQLGGCLKMVTGFVWSSILASGDSACSKGELWMTYTFRDHVHACFFLFVGFLFWDVVRLPGVWKLKM